AFNASFLLCSWAVPQDSAQALHSKAGRKKRRGSAVKHKVTTAGAEDDAIAPSWVLNTWADLKASSLAWGRAGLGKSSPTAARAALSLYRQLLFGEVLPAADEQGAAVSLPPLQRARSVALSALLG
ncbi:unnamed protein product, partial [Polarella glacialis]